jgi:hypothetical protein
VAQRAATAGVSHGLIRRLLWVDSQDSNTFLSSGCVHEFFWQMRIIDHG